MLTPARPAFLHKTILFLLLTLIGLWPAIWSGGPLLFSDSPSYYRGGGIALEAFERKLFPQPATPTRSATATHKPENTPSVTGLRSLSFAVFTNVSMRTFGIFGTVALMSALTAWLMLLFVAHLAPRAQALVTLGTAGLTMMPFYAGQLMPDILAGVLILAAMILALRPELPKSVVLILLATIGFAILSHYAHLPLGLALGVALFIIFWRRGKRLGATLMLAPIALALLVNVGISLNVPTGNAGNTADADASQATSQISAKLPSKKPSISIAPARFPILLARSLEDGPAMKYLQDVCPDPRFTICEIYDVFPSNAGAALWGKDSIHNRATPAQFRRIAEEEIPLLWGALKAYPLEQASALLANTWTQFIRIGYPKVRSANITLDGPKTLSFQITEVFNSTERKALEYMQLTSLALAVLALLANFRVMQGALRSAFWVLLIALVVNAAVCGGLSAPVNRYQGRIIWSVVLLGFTVWALRPGLGFFGNQHRRNQTGRKT
tara:strand:- start:4708 stop:6198 length:1491 start_codon:yes stop_codon:yes gene_type:complete